MTGIKSVKIDRINEHIEETSSTVGEKVKDFLTQGIMTPGLNEIIEEHKNDEIEKMDLNSSSGVELIEKVQELFRKYNINSNVFGYNSSDIQSITTDGFDNDKIVVKMTTGDVFVFKMQGEDYILDTITSTDGTVIHCDIDEYDDNRIKNGISIDPNTKVNGAVYLETNDVLTPVYWLGNLSYQGFKEQLKNIEKAKDAMADEDLNYVFQYGNFRGYYVGADDCSVEGVENYNAYASGRTYVFINTDENPSYETIIHEFGHIIDATSVAGENTYYSTTSPNFEDLFNKYNNDEFKKMLPNNSGYHSDGCPNIIEFFACSYETYVTDPIELQESFPEIYSFIQNFLNNNVRNK